MSKMGGGPRLPFPFVFFFFLHTDYNIMEMLPLGEPAIDVGELGSKHRGFEHVLVTSICPKAQQMTRDAFYKFVVGLMPQGMSDALKACCVVSEIGCETGVNS